MRFMKPHRTGKPFLSVILIHALFPWDGESPCYLGMPDSEYLYLPYSDSILNI